VNWSKIGREYFSYNRRERRGLSVLLFMIGILICLRLAIAFWPHEEYKFSDQQIARLDKLSIAIGQIDTTKPSFSYQNQSSDRQDPNPTQAYYPQVLDPNYANIDLLVETGLNKGSATMLIKYVAAGGKIYDTKALLRVYYMDSNWVEAMMEYFTFPEKPLRADSSNHEPVNDFSKRVDKKQLQSRVDLNTADSMSLERIPGLGPFYVKEIMKLRDKLGGIRDYAQLMMIYKMRDETIDRVADHTFIDSISFSYIYINQVSLDRLGRHPYITWRQAKILINYRFQHGQFENLSDIKKCEVITDSTYHNLLPYLKLQ
jgi:competence protein ComEA